MKNIVTFALAVPLFFANVAHAKTKLVSDESIKSQAELTTEYKLSNGIPVVYRSIPDSDILEVSVSFKSGLKDLPKGKKVLSRWAYSVIPMAAKDWPKEKVFETSEKYAIGIGCGGGIEYSSCALSTLNDHWTTSGKLFSALMTASAITDEDAALVKDRLVAALKATPSDPAGYANEIINRIFYPEGHPYRLNHDEALAELEKLTVKDVREYYQTLLNADLISIVVVGSLNPKTILADFNQSFGKLGKAPVSQTLVNTPKFDVKESYIFESREIPTAYIKVKFNAVPATHKDAVAARLMFEMLSEELSEEIRTKQSLSYSVYSQTLQYSMGIGILSASTSKPKETLVAMNDVVKRMKSRTYTTEEMDEFKTVFATGYFLGQETHASLNSGIASSMFFFGDYNKMYNFPRELDKVTAEEVKRLANELLVDMKVGVIYDRKKFEDKWATDFIKSNLQKASH